MVLFKARRMITPDEALPGRSTPLSVPERHAVFGDRPIKPPFPETTSTLVVGMGCFWGAEKLLWPQPGVFTTAVGYAAGVTPNPTYRCLFPAAPPQDSVPTCAEAGVLGALTGMVGCYFSDERRELGERGAALVLALL